MQVFLAQIYLEAFWTDVQMSERTELGLTSFLNSSNINESQLNTISSGPIDLCLCRDNQPDRN